MLVRRHWDRMHPVQKNKMQCRLWTRLLSTNYVLTAQTREPAKTARFGRINLDLLFTLIAFVLFRPNIP
jgi:hypothetical protein